MMHSGFPKNLISSQSLKAWGYRLKMHKGEKPVDWAVYTPEMLKYCEQDVHVTHTLYNKLMTKEYSEESLKLEHDVQKICTQMMLNGIEFDTAKAKELYSKLSAERETLAKQLHEFFPPWIEESTFIPVAEKSVIVDAINHALHEEMELNEKMVVYGLDIADT